MYTIVCDIDADRLEVASAIGYCHGMGGCVEVPSGDGGVVLTFYFEREDQAVSAASAFAGTLSIDTPAVGYMDDKQDWNAKWRVSMEPAEVASGVWVSPTWLEPPKEGRRAWIKIEPKMAFGTGHHETTRLAAKALIECGARVVNKSILDIGTGSGILCFVAGYLGAKKAVGVEIDADCRENLAENLRDNPPPPGGSVSFIIGTLDTIHINVNNGVSGCICADSGVSIGINTAVSADTGVSVSTDTDISNCVGKDRFFDVIIMNMLLTESAPLLGQVISIVKKGSILIWSGILVDESGEAVSAAGAFGFKPLSTTAENEWWCGTFII